MTRKNYTAVANILRKVNDKNVTEEFADMFEKEFKNFNRDFFIEYIEKGKISTETRKKYKVTIDMKEIVSLDAENEEVSFDVLMKELQEVGGKLGCEFITKY